jgi:hypothetical protein
VYGVGALLSDRPSPPLPFTLAPVCTVTWMIGSDVSSRAAPLAPIGGHTMCRRVSDGTVPHVFPARLPRSPSWPPAV